MDDKDKRGFSSLSDLASGIHEVDNSVSAEKLSDEKGDTITKATVPNEEHGRETDVDKNIHQSSPRKKSLFLKIIKTIGGIFIGFILIIFALFIFMKYQENKKEKEELTYHVDAGWKWHDEFNRIQIFKPIDSETSLLRKVYLENKYVIYAYKDKNYSLSTDVYFVTPCEPGTKIKTSKKFSDGNIKELVCDEDGESLYFGCIWNSNNTNVVWEEDLDGFSFREDFSHWDFKKLDQEITLSKAKK